LEKLAFRRKNTRKNPDDKQTTPVSDPEKLLKTKGYLKKTSASTGKIYQPKVTQVNVKIPTEEVSLLSSKEKHQKPHSAEASTSNPEVKLENPEEVIPKVKLYDLKGENFQNTPISLIEHFYQ
jgi:hypothetical protein